MYIASMEKTSFLFLFISSVVPLPILRKPKEKCEPAHRRTFEDLPSDISQRLRKIQGQIEALDDNSVDSNFIKEFLENEENSSGEPSKTFLNNTATSEAEINRATNVARFLFSGDVRRSLDEMKQLISSLDGQAVRYDAITDNLKFWPKATLPYTFNETFNSQGKAAVKVAMQEISSRTCIQFIPRKKEKNWVEFFHGRGCWSFSGNQKVGVQLLSLSHRDGCTSKGIATHEIMHALGYEHEHERKDRDDYVNINWDNIAEKNYIHFSKLNDNKHTGKKYDYGSIMHYDEKQFAKNFSDVTMTPKKKGIKIGQRKGLSDLDSLSVNKLYCNCDEIDFNKCLLKNSRRDYWAREPVITELRNPC